MTQRNFTKTVAMRRGNINIKYDLSFQDLEHLLNIAAPNGNMTVNYNCIYEAVTKAFAFGYEMGVRAMRKGVPDKKNTRNANEERSLKK